LLSFSSFYLTLHLKVTWGYGKAVISEEKWKILIITIGDILLTCFIAIVKNKRVSDKNSPVLIQGSNIRHFIEKF